MKYFTYGGIEDHGKSAALHNEALKHIAGGVNSPSRSHKATGCMRNWTGLVLSSKKGL